MKIEQLIVQYLYTNKKVTLQDIGVFHMSDNVTIPPEQDKDTFLPDNAIRFEYNTKAVQDDALIDFIVQQTRKIKPLATSDLESFTILGRQFMNIGKPLPIEGLGTLQKNQHGEYEFIQGHSINPRLEPIPAALKEKNKEDIVFTTPPRKQNNKAGMIAVVIIFLILAAAASFYFVFKNNKDQKVDQLAVQKKEGNVAKADTNAQPLIPSNDANQPALIANENVAYNIVIREYKTRAMADGILKRYQSFGHNAILQFSKDSTTYKLEIPFMRPLADSAHLKDSLRQVFAGSNPYLSAH